MRKRVAEKGLLIFPLWFFLVVTKRTGPGAVNPIAKFTFLGIRLGKENGEEFCKEFFHGK